MSFDLPEALLSIALEASYALIETKGDLHATFEVHILGAHLRQRTRGSGSFPNLPFSLKSTESARPQSTAWNGVPRHDVSESVCAHHLPREVADDTEPPNRPPRLSSLDGPISWRRPYPTNGSTHSRSPVPLKATVFASSTCTVRDTVMSWPGPRRGYNLDGVYDVCGGRQRHFRVLAAAQQRLPP